MGKEINVLSLFDGCSAGQIALQQRGIKVKKYYASEIDKYAIKATMAIFPNTIQLGDINNWREWDINWSEVDLIQGGSPCQGFSFAGKQLNFNDPRSKLFFVFRDIVNYAKSQNPNVLFFLENVQMKKESEVVISREMGINPITINSALLSAQNRVRLYWTNIANEPFGLFGDIFCNIPQPKDKGILLKHVLEKDVPEKYFLSNKMMNYFSKRASNFNNGKVNIRQEEGKASCLTSSSASCDISDNFIKVDTDLRVSKNQGKANCFTAGGHSGGLHSDMTLIGCLKFGRTDEAKQIRKQNMQKGFDSTPFSKKEIIGIDTEKLSTLTTSSNKDNLIMQLNPSLESGVKQPYQQNRVYDSNGIAPALCRDKADLLISLGNIYDNELNPSAGRVYSIEGKSSTLLSDGGGGGAKTGLYQVDENPICHNTMPRSSKSGKGGTGPLKREDGKTYCLDTGQTNAIEFNQTIRRLTPREAGRLQTFPEPILDIMLNCGVSETQLYKMFGNSWTVDVIAYIYSFIKL